MLLPVNSLKFKLIPIESNPIMTIQKKIFKLFAHINGNFRFVSFFSKISPKRKELKGKMKCYS